MAFQRLKWSLCATALVLFSGCGSEFKRPDTSGHEVSLAVEPFYKDLMESGETDMRKLSDALDAKYGDFYEGFCLYELRLGQPGSMLCDSMLSLFLRQPENAEVMALCDSVFANIDIDRQVSDAFSCFGALFPDKPVPQSLLCHFSFFNSRILVDSAYVSFGIENYLGSDCRFYDWLAVPRYARQTREVKWIVPDLVRAWVMATMPDESGKEDVLTALIYQAKVLYAVHSCLPDIDEATLFGFTPDQMEWCRQNEANMWARLVERKLLYSTNVLDRNKIVNDAPFTFFFGNASPGRAALFCGYNIVRQFMKRNPEVTISLLLSSPDAQAILQGSRYNP